MQKLSNDDGAKRSLMMRNLPLCNGQQTGRQCKYYWGMIKRVDAENKDHLRDGEKLRFCLLDTADTTFLGDGGMDMPHYCTQYVKGKRAYDAKFEDYNPMTPEEIAALAASDKPVSDNDGFLNWKRLFKRG